MVNSLDQKLKNETLQRENNIEELRTLADPLFERMGKLEHRISVELRPKEVIKLPEMKLREPEIKEPVVDILNIERE